MAEDQGFINNISKDISEPTKVVRKALSGNMNDRTLSEAVVEFVQQASLDKKTSKAIQSKRLALQKNLKNIALDIFDQDGNQIKTTLAEVKVGDLGNKNVKEAIGSALLNQKGYLGTLNNRKNLVSTLQPVIKGLVDPSVLSGQSYFKDLVAPTMGGAYADSLNTAADRKLITILTLDHKRLSEGYGTVLEKLVDKPTHAQAFTLMVTGGFRPSDLEKLSLSEVQLAVDTDILHYETKVGGGIEYRYRPVLPEHKAVFQKIIQDAKNTGIDNPDSKAFPQGNKYSELKKDLNKLLLEEFGPEFLRVQHPHKAKVTSDPVTISTLRHHFESRLVRVGMTDEKSRQDIMGRSTTGKDLGSQYAAVSDRVGPGSEVHNLGIRANNILSLEASSSKGLVNTLSLDWIPEDAQNTIFSDPSNENINRPVVDQANILNQRVSPIQISEKGYTGVDDSLIKANKKLLEDKNNIVNYLVRQLGVSEDEVLTNELHRFVGSLDEAESIVESIPEDSRNIQSFLQVKQKQLDISKKPFTDLKAGKQIDQLLGQSQEEPVDERKKAFDADTERILKETDNLSLEGVKKAMNKLIANKTVRKGLKVLPYVGGAFGAADVLETKEAEAQQYADEGENMPEWLSSIRDAQAVEEVASPLPVTTFDIEQGAKFMAEEVPKGISEQREIEMDTSDAAGFARQQAQSVRNSFTEEYEGMIPKSN